MNYVIMYNDYEEQVRIQPFESCRGEASGLEGVATPTIGVTSPSRRFLHPHPSSQPRRTRQGHRWSVVECEVDTLVEIG